MKLIFFLFFSFIAQFSGAARFIGISSKVTWPAAQAYCRTYHTDLASSLNNIDNNMIWQVRDIQGDSWFGLYRDTWKWSDGTNALNTPWASGQPDNYGGNENCAVVYNGNFYDTSCSTQFYFFCHTIPPVRQRQIVRLQVKSDGSVFDSAAQSSILEQVSSYWFPGGLVVRMRRSHRCGPGSIHGQGTTAIKVAQALVLVPSPDKWGGLR
ncbi:L-selectin-like isoform X2 [Silurus meridionalis]|nr:L-selectin-like isoform X2 [Silurus meridionalis]